MAEFKDKEGNLYRVPDSETEDLETMRASGEYEELPPTQPTETAKPSIFETALRSGTQGVSLGFADELAGGINAGIEKLTGYDVSDLGNIRRSEMAGKPYSDIYDQRLRQIREANLASEKANPKTAMVSDIAGSMIAPGAAMGAASKLPMLARLGTQAAIGAGTGVIEGAGRADSPEGLLSADTAKKAALSGAIGGVGAPIGDLGVSMGSWSLRKGLRKAGETFDPQGRLLGRAQRIEQMAKDLAGPSPQEELASAEALIGEHGKRLARDIQYDIVDKTGGNISGLAYSTDKIMDAANTGLKGSATMKRLKAHVASDPNPGAFQKKIFDRSNKHLDSVQSVVQKLRQRAKDNLTAGPSTGPQVTRIDKAIASYKKTLADAQGAPYLGLGKGGVEPEVMSDTYIALDNIKRALGNAQARIKGDKTSQEEVRSAYEGLRRYLEDPKVWGSDVAAMQKDLNKSWVKYLNVADAVESTFLKTGKKSTAKSASGWDKVGEADLGKIQSLLADPKKPENAAQLKNLKVWMDATDELTGKLTKYYKPTPEMAREVARVKTMRQKVLEQLDNAGYDFSRADEAGMNPSERALQDIGVAAKRGIPESKDVGAIRELQAQREALSSPMGKYQRGEEYAKRVEGEASNLFDQVPIFRQYRQAERGAKALQPGVAARFGSSDFAEELLGKEPMTKEKANIKALEKNPNITKEQKEDIYRQLSIEDRKSKGGKTTVV